MSVNSHQLEDTNELEGSGFSFLDDPFPGFGCSFMTPLQSPLLFSTKSPNFNSVEKSNDRFNLNDFDDDKIHNFSQILNEVEVITNLQTPFVQINQINVFPVINPPSPKLKDSQKIDSLEPSKLNEFIRFTQVSNSNFEQQKEDPKTNSQLESLEQEKLNDAIRFNFDQNNENQPQNTEHIIHQFDYKDDDAIHYTNVPLKKQLKRKNFSDEARKTMKLWLLSHWMYPYPSIQEKKKFAKQFNLTERQIQIFLTNQRSRLLHRKGWGSKKTVIITEELSKRFSNSKRKSKGHFIEFL